MNPLTSIRSSYTQGSGLLGVKSDAQSAVVGAATSSVKTSTAAKPAALDVSVAISPAAQLAAASLEDNKKDFAALATEVRAVLDKSYAAGGAKGDPTVSGMTGRALASIVLNRNGGFSRTEVAAAKRALNEQMRGEFATASSGRGGQMAGLAAYSKQVVGQYDRMSAEEREARGWTDRFRTSNADFASQTMPSLFDQMRD